ncbi:hypothetical protein TIFTF001_012345 [Ficus carica]|uniref:Uncharacterized protein n=1 Tax=Ficus carica TaxID=3494 RepID=A0AA88A1J3_FICCA|nr:hypothetical protein TIFTF001_012345 [Ficus carica]
MGVDARNGSGSNSQCDRAFPAGPGARGDPAGSATLGTRWVRRPVGATGLIDGRHVALGPVGGRRRRLVGCQYNRCQTTDDHLGHDMEAEACAILAEGVRVLRAVATRVPGSDRVIASLAKWVFPKQQRSEPRRLGAFPFYARYEQASGRLLRCLGVLGGVAVEFRHVSGVPHVGNFTWHRAAGGKAIRQLKFQNLNLREQLAGRRSSNRNFKI